MLADYSQKTTTGELASLKAKYRIIGRVQGVGYRWWLHKQAELRGLGGFVRNEPDGSVTVLLVGSHLEDVANWLSSGPASAHVRSVTRLKMDESDLQWDIGKGISILG